MYDQIDESKVKQEVLRGRIAHAEQMATGSHRNHEQRVVVVQMHTQLPMQQSSDEEEEDSR